MAKRHGKRIGSGITERVVEETWLDPKDPDDAVALAGWLQGLPDRLNAPWGCHARVIDAVRDQLREVRAGLSHLDPCSREHNRHFSERASEAWYLREINVTARAVELAVEGGRPWEAVSRAMQIGELLAEVRLKHEWDEDGPWGRLRREELRAAAAGRRKSSAADRIAKADEFRAAGMGAREALEAAASHFGISKSALSKDYYKKPRSTPVE